MALGEERASDVRLDIVTWEALCDVANRKGRPVAALIKEIAGQEKKRNLTAAIRHYVVEYYRDAARKALDDAEG